MHARGIGRNRPMVLPFKGERERERGTWLNEMGEILSWDRYWKRKKTLYILRGSGG